MEASSFSADSYHAQYSYQLGEWTLFANVVGCETSAFETHVRRPILEIKTTYKMRNHQSKNPAKPVHDQVWDGRNIILTGDTNWYNIKLQI